MTGINGYFSSFQTPILFLIYNRPEKTQKVFDVLKRLRPSTIFVAADGPKENKPNDLMKCKATREIVSGGINWKCDTRFLLRDSNLGCRLAVSSAITWFFEEVKEGIVLEEDCLPGEDFFRFCQELLSKYRNTEEVFHIGGASFLQKTVSSTDYYFSVFTHIWGWATWRRAWKHYDVDMSDFRSFEETMLPRSVRRDPESRKYWMNIFSQVHEKRMDTWDYQWTYAMWRNTGLAINPGRNLVSNIGFESSASHTREATGLANIPVSRMGFPLRHPKSIRPTKWADRYSARYVFGIPYRSRLHRMGQFAKMIIRNAVPFGIIQSRKRKRSEGFESMDGVQNEDVIALLRDIPRFTKTMVRASGLSIDIIDKLSFVFMYQEIFGKEIYKFNSKSEQVIIVDCGANIGLSVMYFKRLYPAARIIAFEPDPIAFEVLRANVVRNGFSGVELHNSALWSIDGESSFVPDGADGGRLSVASAGPGLVNVKVESLRRYLGPRIDMLKIDIEGAEFEVSRGCT